MLIQRFNQALVASYLLLGLFMPAYTAPGTEEYPVIIRFSNNADAKQMIHSSYSTLVELHNILDVLNKYTVHSLSTGLYFEDQTFQDKKNKITQALNKQKLTLHVFRNQALYIDFHDPKDSKHYAIRIPVFAYSELGLENTTISTIDDAKKAQDAISDANVKLRSLLTPEEVTTPDNNKMETGLNILKIKNPKTFIAISNSLEQVFRFYSKKLQKLEYYANKAASGKYNEKEMEILDTEYRYLVYDLSWQIDYSYQTINSINLFKGNELTLNVDNNQQKVYYMPEISLPTLQLDNDSIYDHYTAIKSYFDLHVASNWILDWNITGQQEFIPGSDNDRTKYALHFKKKNRNRS